MKRAADKMSRSQYEIFNFSVKHSLSEDATNELLMLVGHVRVLQIICFQVNSLLVTLQPESLTRKIMQVRFSPEGIEHKTMKSMDKAARMAMLPNYQIYCADLSEGNGKENLFHSLQT